MKPYAKVDKPRKLTSPLSPVPSEPKSGTKSNVSLRPVSKPSLSKNTPTAQNNDKTSDDSSDEDYVPMKKTTARIMNQSVKDKENQIHRKATTKTTDLSIEDMDCLKMKFIKITNRYFIYKCNPSDHNVWQIVKEKFYLDPNVGAGYVIYKLGMQTFNNM